MIMTHEERKTFVIGDVHGRRAQLERLLAELPRGSARDTLVLLGDLVDRGGDAPGVVECCTRLAAEEGDRFVLLRGNHEQMLFDFIDGESEMWLHPACGGAKTISQYGVAPALILACTGEDADADDLERLRDELRRLIPAAHLDLLRSARLFHEDDFAIYVHAGLAGDLHPRDTPPDHLIWSRDHYFFSHYTGKPCVFGHTPVPLLPLRGRVGRHGIYVCHSAVGIDSGYTFDLPLSCLELPAFVLRQAFADGRMTTHRIGVFMPKPLRALRAHHESKRHAEKQSAAGSHDEAAPHTEV